MRDSLHQRPTQVVEKRATPSALSTGSEAERIWHAARRELCAHLGNKRPHLEDAAALRVRA